MKTQRTKRVHARVGTTYRVTIVPCVLDDSGGKATSAWIRDLSVSGLGVVTKAVLRKNQYFILALPMGSGTEVNIMCRVEAIKLNAKAGNQIGGRFIGFYDAKAQEGKKIRRFRHLKLKNAA